MFINIQSIIGLSQTGIPALPFRHNFVSYISVMTTKDNCVGLAITFGRKKGCSLDIYIVNVARYFENHKKINNIIF